jgi:putative membrane protein
LFSELLEVLPSRRTSSQNNSEDRWKYFREVSMNPIYTYLNWKVALMSLMINMFAIATVAILLPGINIFDTRLIVLILAAVFLGLLNTFVKPLLQLITMRLLFMTYGLVLIATNTIILLLLGWLFNDTIEITGLLPAILGAILITLISVFLDYLLGVLPPLGYIQALREEEEMAR